MLKQNSAIVPRASVFSGKIGSSEWMKALNSVQPADSSITRLPTEVLEQILVRVKIQDLFSLKQVRPYSLYR